MNVQAQIDQYIATQPQPKREDMQVLHRMMLKISPDCKLWFLDGRNSDGKIVSNPNIGYGSQTTRYADGGTREFYRIGLSGNTIGMSIYILGSDDKTYLSETYGARLGKAKITGYCIKFRCLKDINVDVLEEIFETYMVGTDREVGDNDLDCTPSMRQRN